MISFNEKENACGEQGWGTVLENQVLLNIQVEIKMFSQLSNSGAHIRSKNGDKTIGKELCDYHDVRIM